LNAPYIEFDNVTIVRGAKRVLSSLSLSIAQGEHIAILGPNGCGKSTFIKALTRELYPYAGSGHVRIAGQDKWVISELRTVLGVVSEGPPGPLLGEPTGLEMAVSGLIGTYGVLVQHEVTPAMWDRGRQSLDLVEALHLANQEVDTMSTGERKRVTIARALAPNPKALVLDEPTSGLDMKAASEFHTTMSRIANSGAALILVTHHLEEIVPEIDRLILLKDGAVFADGPRSELLQTDVICELFDVDDKRLRSQIEHRLHS